MGTNSKLYRSGAIGIGTRFYYFGGTNGIDGWTLGIREYDSATGAWRSAYNLPVKHKTGFATLFNY